MTDVFELRKELFKCWEVFVHELVLERLGSGGPEDPAVGIVENGHCGWDAGGHALAGSCRGLNDPEGCVFFGKDLVAGLCHLDLARTVGGFTQSLLNLEGWAE